MLLQDPTPKDDTKSFVLDKMSDTSACQSISWYIPLYLNFTVSSSVDVATPRSIPCLPRCITVQFLLYTDQYCSSFQHTKTISC